MGRELRLPGERRLRRRVRVRGLGDAYARRIPRATQQLLYGAPIRRRAGLFVGRVPELRLQHRRLLLRRVLGPDVRRHRRRRVSGRLRLRHGTAASDGDANPLAAQPRPHHSAACPDDTGDPVHEPRQLPTRLRLQFFRPLRGSFADTKRRRRRGRLRDTDSHRHGR